MDKYISHSLGQVISKASSSANSKDKWQHGELGEGGAGSVSIPPPPLMSAYTENPGATLRTCQLTVIGMWMWMGGPWWKLVKGTHFQVEAFVLPGSRRVGC